MAKSAPNVSEVTAPLRQLLRKDAAWNWTCRATRIVILRHQDFSDRNEPGCAEIFRLQASSQSENQHMHASLNWVRY